MGEQLGPSNHEPRPDDDSPALPGTAQSQGQWALPERPQEEILHAGDSSPPENAAPRPTAADTAAGPAGRPDDHPSPQAVDITDALNADDIDFAAMNIADGPVLEDAPIECVPPQEPEQDY